MNRICTFFLILLLSITTSYAQLENYINRVNQQDVANYVKPLATSLGTILNSGAYHTAEIPKTFGISISVIGAMVMVPTDQKSFTPVGLPSGYSNITPTSTVFGDKQGAYYLGAGEPITFPGGFAVDNVAFAIPQASVSLFGTQATLRYAGGFKIGDRGVNMFGLGVRHSVSQYIPLIPVDVAVHGFYNTFSIENVTSTSNVAFGAEVSKNFSILTPYAGFQFENTSVTVKYKDTKNNLAVDIDVTGDNKFRATFGVALNLAFIVLNLDYNLSSQSAITSGLTLKF